MGAQKVLFLGIPLPQIFFPLLLGGHAGELVQGQLPATFCTVRQISSVCHPLGQLGAAEVVLNKYLKKSFFKEIKI
jgi:hypothetical protein